MGGVVLVLIVLIIVAWVLISNFRVVPKAPAYLIERLGA